MEKFENLTKQEILAIEEESGHFINELIEEFHDMSSLPKDKKESKNIMIAIAEKELKKRYDDFQKN
jgi:hypothetical protein